MQFHSHTRPKQSWNETTINQSYNNWGYLNTLLSCSSTSLPGNRGFPPLAISVEREEERDVVTLTLTNKSCKQIHTVMLSAFKEKWKINKTTRKNSGVLYSGKLSREKFFVDFTVWWLFMKVFSAKFGGVVYQSCQCQYDAKWAWMWRGVGQDREGTCLQTLAYSLGHCVQESEGVCLLWENSLENCAAYYYWTDCY